MSTSQQQSSSRNSYSRRETNTSLKKTSSSNSEKKPSASVLEVIKSAESQIEKAIIESKNPIVVPNSEEVIINDEEKGLWLNKDEVVNWKGPLPLDEYKLNEDPNPIIVKKKPADKVKYKQEVHIKYLKPPTPKPAEIIVIQEPDKQLPPAPPLVIRKAPSPAPTPEPIIIREAPPPSPAPALRKVIVVPGKILPPPARKVIYEKCPEPPQKPQKIIIERWLKPKTPKPKIIYCKPIEEPRCIPCEPYAEVLPVTYSNSCIPGPQLSTQLPPQAPTGYLNSPLYSQQRSSFDHYNQRAQFLEDANGRREYYHDVFL